MIEKIHEGNLVSIENAAFRSYAEIYVGVDRGFRDSVESLGLPFASRPLKGYLVAEGGVAGCPREGAPVLPLGLAEHIGRGLDVVNDGKSYVVGWQSPACIACRLGLRTATFLLSTQCPRRCFFCFNVNQADHESLRALLRDAAGELASLHARGAKLEHIALTGGEPLLHREEALAFFRTAAELYPDAHTRLYTSGWGLDEGLAAKLRDAGLREIRFSVKTEDEPEEINAFLDVIRRTTCFIPDVMVEMPVVPGELELMKGLLLKLDEAGVRGINLLELGYPLANATEFARRGLRIRAEPMRVLYDYSYAGGLPVDGSEEACLELLEFALERGLSMGVHYCSMENKSTGQVFRQNAPAAKLYPLRAMSKQDHFLKSAKVFGSDVPRVRATFEALGLRFFEYDVGYDLLEFPPAYLPEIADQLPDVEVSISYGIVEVRDGERVLRELRLDRTTPATFDLEVDL